MKEVRSCSETAGADPGKRKVALKLAYLGQRYHGFQRQPQVPTVESVVREALDDLGLGHEGFCYAGRTDRGVSALGQVVTFSFEPEYAKLAVPRVINSKLPWDVWAWAWATVPENFSARYGALWREYRYVLCREDLDTEPMRKAAKMLEGAHDFKNLSTEKSGNTTRNLMSLVIEGSGDVVVLNVKADGFLWNMVRKIVTALEKIGSYEKELDWIQDLLDPQLNRGVAAAPPEGLTLVDVGYPELVDWTLDPYSRKMASERLFRDRRRKAALAETTGQILRSML